jgi:hypothetical protein
MIYLFFTAAAEVIRSLINKAVTFSFDHIHYLRPTTLF